MKNKTKKKKKKAQEEEEDGKDNVNKYLNADNRDLCSIATSSSRFKTASVCMQS